MGNAATRQPAQFVLVPPLFEPAGLYDRDARAYSAYRMAFGQSHRARFFSHMYTAGGASCRVALRPPGENIDIAVAATEAHGGGIAPELSLHYALPANSPFSGSFVKASNKSGSGGGLCLSGCALHARSGAGGFFRARPGASPLVGARLSNPGLGIGLGAAGQDDKGMVLAWAVARLKAGLMLGYEFSREHEETETERVALGYGKKRGGTRLDAVMELRQPRDRTRAELAMSFLYHFSVRRDVQNPIERMDVVGITNYVDIGAEMVTSIHDNELREFQVGAAWQVLDISQRLCLCLVLCLCPCLYLNLDVSGCVCICVLFCVFPVSISVSVSESVSVSACESISACVSVCVYILCLVDAAAKLQKRRFSMHYLSMAA